jgi:hypothetical protein
MLTLRQQYPDAYRELRQAKYFSTAAMLDRFTHPTDMEKALRASPYVVKRWLLGVHKPQKRLEQRAHRWLRENPKIVQEKPAQEQLDLRDTVPTRTTTKVSSDEWKTELSRDKLGENKALLVTCSPTQLPKLQKIVSMLRCEAVELA